MYHGFESVISLDHHLLDHIYIYIVFPELFDHGMLVDVEILKDTDHPLEMHDVRYSDLEHRWCCFSFSLMT